MLKRAFRRTSSQLAVIRSIDGMSALSGVVDLAGVVAGLSGGGAAAGAGGAVASAAGVDVSPGTGPGRALVREMGMVGRTLGTPPSGAPGDCPRSRGRSSELWRR